ncbi:uncharacterized protein LOC129766475 [Toxorhynchites rutilus septentrionalis]|uniref:uncharacterized protein LOC129766475 n=1 Tax=Toxorhynchites rutilus septentrionalis TaxID=329112 RepID=UPI00247B00F5|nr:uncharacterized protein LOC129766475 [Toxorhynchites rutilus septentrionalis]
MNFSGDVSSSELEVRLEKLNQLWDEFGAVLVEVRAHNDFEGSESLDTERQEFSDHYYESTLDRVRLPQITLQTFGGSFEEWLSFKDLYISLIHSRGDLSEVEKFYFLKGCLQGVPRRLIDPLQITSGNYRIAWNILMERYDNNKQMKKRQVESLFHLPSLTTESPGELHALLDGLERTIQSLDQIVKPSEYKDLLLISLTTARLDPVTRRDWEDFSCTKDQDTLKDLLDFLQRRKPLYSLCSISFASYLQNIPANDGEGQGDIPTASLSLSKLSETGSSGKELPIGTNVRKV